MKAIIKSAAVSLIAFAAASAFAAPASTDVDLKDTNVKQSGALNSQAVNVGNAQ